MMQMEVKNKEIELVLEHTDGKKAGILMMQMEVKNKEIELGF